MTEIFTGMCGWLTSLTRPHTSVPGDVRDFDDVTFQVRGRL